jgi:hypothetical protein
MKNKSYDTLIIFIVYLLLLVCITFFSSCTKEEVPIPKDVIEMSIDTRLPVDGNGYSHFRLYTQQSQNIHRISGSIRVNNKIPTEPREKIDWKSSHYWVLKEGDTVATITKSYLNYYTGQWTVVTLPPLVSSINSLVPTINPVCYNSEDGSINTVIAPLYNMKGDTLIVTAKIRNITKIAKIVLD